MSLTILGGIVQLLGAIYYVLAAVVIVVAFVKPKTRQGKAIATSIALAVFGFFPVKGWLEKRAHDAYAKEAWAYFRKMCDEKAGEKIFKQYSGVKSVVVMKPLPPASDKDNFNQFWYGDPYSAYATHMRVDNAAGTLVYPNAPISARELGKGFDFVEAYSPPINGVKGDLYKYVFDPALRDYRKAPLDRPRSTVAIYWEDISTLSDRSYWVAGSRLSIVDLSDKSLIAERIGYFIEPGFGSAAGQRRPWLTARGPRTTCPPVESGDYHDRFFIIKALKP